MAKRSRKKKKAAEQSVASSRPEVNPLSIAWRALLIVAAGFCVYAPALHGEWLWDDDELITANEVVHDPAGWWRIWFEPQCLLDYLPLKVTVEWIEWHLFGNDTLGYHLVSLVLHLTGALLVWRLLGKFGLRFAWLGGLIFTIHPVMVESVAWIAELKNTLSMPPFLLAMIAWIDFQENRRGRDYALAVAMFLVAMLCKLTMVLFPVVILLYAWWRRQRIGGRDLLESVPFFAISLVLGSVTVWFLNHHARAELITLGGPLSRIACAGMVLMFYFQLSVWPVGLLTIYPHWSVVPPSPEQFWPWPVFAGVLAYLWTQRKGWGRHVLLGLAFFVINLLPFLGFNAAAYMGFTWVADHMLYLPIIGLIGLVVLGLDRLWLRLDASLRPVGIGAVTILMGLMAWSSFGYAQSYQTLEGLWARTVRGNPEAFLAYNNLGVAMVAKNRNAEAIDLFRQALVINPRYPDAHTNLGKLLLQDGHFEEALVHFRAAVEVDPWLAENHFQLGLALDKNNRLDDSMNEYREALRINPRHVGARNNLAIALVGLKRYDEAIAELQAALQVDPNNTDLQHNLVAVRKLQK